MSYSYQFRLKIIKLVTEQNYGIREMAKLHQIFHTLVIYWLKAFRERGLDSVKSPYTNLQTPKIVKPKMKKLGIHSILRKKRHGKRGKTSHIAPNLLNRDFTATALNQKWVMDVTEF